jgi:hypothetical protein
MSFSDSWYLSIIPMLIGGLMQFTNARKMSKTHALTQGVIRSWFHLNRVRDAINLSMRLAIIYLGLSGAMLAVLLGCVFFAGMSIATMTTHLFLFGVITLPVGLWGKTAENRIKGLQVQASDPEIARRFNDYVVQWGQARLQLQGEVEVNAGTREAESDQQRKHA